MFESGLLTTAGFTFKADIWPCSSVQNPLGHCGSSDLVQLQAYRWGQAAQGVTETAQATDTLLAGTHSLEHGVNRLDIKDMKSSRLC